MAAPPDSFRERMNMAANNKLYRREGQSTIEFLVTFPMVILFLFFFMKLSFNFTMGYLAHYATFMSSRTFLVYDDDSTFDTNAENAARGVFKSILLDRVSKKFSGNPTFNSIPDVSGAGNASPVFKGAVFEYQETFSISNLLGGTDKISLVSESFLGREPTRVGCLQRICRSLEQLTGNCVDLVTLSDNGC